jgi:AcrR family transcriptional regulator
MQVLKEAVRQKIIKSSKKEFKKNGFDNAAMGDIADSAGVTVGNIYRYYKSKQDIFNALIDELYLDIKKLIDSNKENKENFTQILKSLVEIQRNYKTEWMILSNANKGTKYTRIMDELSTLLSQAMIDEYGGSKGFDESIAQPVIQAIISGLQIILQNEKADQENDAVELFLDFILKD